MKTQIVTLEDGTRVQIEVSEDQAQQIAGGFDTIKGSFDTLQPVLMRVCRPLVNTWQELNKDLSIEQAEVELGLSFEGEGNLFITKSTLSANLKVKLILKPKDHVRQDEQER